MERTEDEKALKIQVSHREGKMGPGASKAENKAQTFKTWVFFFDSYLGSKMYSQSTMSPTFFSFLSCKENSNIDVEMN